MQLVPDDILTDILSFLPLRQLWTIGIVCKRFRDLTRPKPDFILTKADQPRPFDAVWKKALNKQAWEWEFGPIANYSTENPTHIEKRTVLRNIIVRLEAIDILRRALVSSKVRLVAWQENRKKLPLDITINAASIRTLQVNGLKKRYLQLITRERLTVAREPMNIKKTWNLDAGAYSHLVKDRHVFYDDDDSDEQAFDYEGEYIGNNGVYKGVYKEPWWDDEMKLIQSHYYDGGFKFKVELREDVDMKETSRLMRLWRVHIEFAICEDMRGFRPLRLMKFLSDHVECLKSTYCCPYEYLSDFLFDGLGAELAEMVKAGLLPKPQCECSIVAMLLRPEGSPTKKARTQ
jgi:hypothetical protein